MVEGGNSFDEVLKLIENRGVAFQGGTKAGSFDISGDVARDWLKRPFNPNGRLNKDVLRPWINAMDVTRRLSDKWIVDFGWTMTEVESSFFEAPFDYCKVLVWPERQLNRRDMYRINWWRYAESREGMWKALNGTSRFLVTPMVSKHRVFLWIDHPIWPSNLLNVIARDDDTSFGILHSTFHELLSLRIGTSLEDRPRYTPSTTFETFPFPEGLIPNIPAADYADDRRAIAIATAAARLNELRENW